MDIVEKVRGNAKKFTAAALSIGVGVSAAAGFAFIDDTSDLKESLDLVGQQEGDQVSSVDSQIDESKQRLDTVAASTDNDVKYTRLGC